MTTSLSRLDFISEARSIVNERFYPCTFVADYKDLSFAQFLECVNGDFQCLLRDGNPSQNRILEHWAKLLSQYMQDALLGGASDIADSVTEIEATGKKIIFVYDAIATLKEHPTLRDETKCSELESELAKMFPVRFSPMVAEAYRLQIKNVESNASRLVTRYRSTLIQLRRLINQYYLSPGEAGLILYKIGREQKRIATVYSITAGEIASFIRAQKVKKTQNKSCLK